MEFLDCKRTENRMDNSPPRVSPSQRIHKELILNLKMNRSQCQCGVVKFMITAIQMSWQVCNGNIYINGAASTIERFIFTHIHLMAFLYPLNITSIRKLSLSE